MNMSTHKHSNGVNGFSDHRGRTFSEVTDLTKAAEPAKDRRPMAAQIADLNDQVGRQRQTITEQRAEMDHFAQHHDEHVRELSKQFEDERSARYAAERRADDRDSKIRSANEQINALKSALAAVLNGVKTST